MIAELATVVARSIVRRRAVWVSATLAVLVASVWTSTRLAFRLSIADFVPDPPAGDLPAELRRELSGGGRLAVVLESGDSIPLTDVAPLFEFLVPRLAALPGVRAIHWRLTAAQRRFAEEHLPTRIALYLEPGVLAAAADRLSRTSIEAALLRGEEPPTTALPHTRAQRERDPLGVLRLAAQGVRPWQGVARVRLIDGYYALPGARAFFLTIESATTLDDIGTARAMVAAVRDVLDAARADSALAPALARRQLYAVGRAVSYVSAVRILSVDGTRVVLAATLAALVLLALLFRGIAAPLIIAATVAAGLAVTGAVAAVAFGSVSLFTWVFVGLLVGLGVDYGIHIASHYWVYGATAGDRTDALASALARPGGGVTLGALTSAAAFLALLTIPYPWMTELAVLTAVGLLAMLLCSFTVLPLLLSFTQPVTRRGSLWARWGAWFARASRRPLLRATAPWILLLLATVIAVPGLRFEPHPWRLAVRGNPESARLDRLNREAGTAFTPLLIVSTGATAEEALARDREAVRRLQPVALQAGVATIQSLARWLPAPDVQRTNVLFVRERRDLFSPERFRRDFEAVVRRMDRPAPYLTETYLPAILRGLDPEITELTLEDLRGLGLGPEVDRHLVRAGDGHIAVSYVFLRRFPWAEGVATTFADVARRAGVEDLPGVTLVGDALRSARHVEVIRRAAVTATVIAALLVGGLLWLRLRRWAHVALCLAPLACGLGAALVLVRLLSIELTLLSIAIAPILVGIGVDDGIHMMDRLRSGDDPGTALRETGAAMTMTTLTTIAAFAALGLATFTGIREVGLIGAVGLLVCLAASLHVIPVAWRVLGRGEPPA